MKKRFFGAAMVLGAICLGGIGCSAENDSAAETPAASSDYLVTMTVPNVASLPKCTGGMSGDIAFVSSPPSLWDCVASRWIAIPCTPFQSGQVAYSNQTQSLIACVEGQWTPIALDGGAGPQGPQGNPGATGATGATGAAGAVSIVVQTPEPSGANCANGGSKISSGLDTNADGVLESSEVTSISYVCNGATGATGDAGSAGANSLVDITPEIPGTNCSTGGQRVDVGLDVNADGILETNEIQNTVFVCNGLTGPAGDAGAPTTPTAPLGAPEESDLFMNVPGVDGPSVNRNFLKDFEVQQFGFLVSNVGGSAVWSLNASLFVSAPLIQLAQEGTTVPQLTFLFTKNSKGESVVYTQLTATNAVLTVTSVASGTDQSVMTIAVTFSAVTIQQFSVSDNGTSRVLSSASWNLTTSTGAPSTSTTPFDFKYNEEPDTTSSAIQVASYALDGTSNPVLALSAEHIDQASARGTSALLNSFLAAAQGATFPTGALDVYRNATGTSPPALVGSYAFTNTQVKSFAIQGSAVNLALAPASYSYTAAP